MFSIEFISITRVHLWENKILQVVQSEDTYYFLNHQQFVSSTSNLYCTGNPAVKIIW